MDDKVTPSTDASEYKYNESEAVPIDAASVGQAAGPGAAPVPGEQGIASRFNLKNIDLKRLMRPSLIVLGIALVYFGLNFYSTKKNKGLEQKKITMQEDAAQVQQQQAMMSVQPAAASTTPRVEMNVGIDNDQMTQIQKVVQQKIDGVAQQVASGQERFSNMSETISKAEQDLSSLNQKVDQLTVATQQMLSDIEKIKSPPKAKSKKVFKQPVAYHIRAIIPGRVWLESADGQSVTLRVGDKLEGYGEVRVIAPRQGMVIMGNGSVIQYGINDF